MTEVRRRRSIWYTPTPHSVHWTYSRPGESVPHLPPPSACPTKPVGKLGLLILEKWNGPNQVPRHSRDLEHLGTLGPATVRTGHTATLLLNTSSLSTITFWFSLRNKNCKTRKNARESLAGGYQLSVEQRQLSKILHRTERTENWTELQAASS